MAIPHAGGTQQPPIKSESDLRLPQMRTPCHYPYSSLASHGSRTSPQLYSSMNTSGLYLEQILFTLYLDTKYRLCNLSHVHRRYCVTLLTVIDAYFYFCCVCVIRKTTSIVKGWSNSSRLGSCLLSRINLFPVLNRGAVRSAIQFELVRRMTASE